MEGAKDDRLEEKKGHRARGEDVRLYVYNMKSMIPDRPAL